MRGQHIGSDLVDHMAASAAERGFSTLCAFTHEPARFVRLGFTIVPHMGVVVAHDSRLADDNSHVQGERAL